jgi:hypothetical protein
MHSKEAFGKSKHTASGFMSACREVINQRNQAAHVKNRERNILRHAKLRQLRRSSPERITWALKRMLDAARTTSRQRGLEFRLSLADLEPVSECPAFGWQLVYQAVGTPLDNSASLDRIDSRLGYVPGNVWIISRKANRVKMDSTPYEMRMVADAVEYKFNSVKEKLVA